MRKQQFIIKKSLCGCQRESPCMWNPLRHVILTSRSQNDHRYDVITEVFLADQTSQPEPSIFSHRQQPAGHHNQLAFRHLAQTSWSQRYMDIRQSTGSTSWPQVTSRCMHITHIRQSIGFPFRHHSIQCV